MSFSSSEMAVSSCSMLCVDDMVKRSLLSPLGTAGYIAGGTKTPFSKSLAESLTASASDPIMTGTMALSPARHVFMPHSLARRTK